jgi:hypothetical protein
MRTQPLSRAKNPFWVTIRSLQAVLRRSLNALWDQTTDRGSGLPINIRPELEQFESRYFPGQSPGSLNWVLSGAGLSILNEAILLPLFERNYDFAPTGINASDSAKLVPCESLAWTETAPAMNITFEGDSYISAPTTTATVAAFEPQNSTTVAADTGLDLMNNSLADPLANDLSPWLTPAGSGAGDLSSALSGPMLDQGGGGSGGSSSAVAAPELGFVPPALGSSRELPSEGNLASMTTQSAVPSIPITPNSPLSSPQNPTPSAVSTPSAPISSAVQPANTSSASSPASPPDPSGCG